MDRECMDVSGTQRSNDSITGQAAKIWRGNSSQVLLTRFPDTLPETNIATRKLMVGGLHSFWDAIFSRCYLSSREFEIMRDLLFLPPPKKTPMIVFHRT